MSIGIQAGAEILLPAYTNEYSHASWTMKFGLYLLNEQLVFTNNQFSA